MATSVWVQVWAPAVHRRNGTAGSRGCCEGGTPLLSTGLLWGVAIGVSFNRVRGICGHVP